MKTLVPNLQQPIINIADLLRHLGYCAQYNPFQAVGRVSLPVKAVN